jgi:AraC-like DNA-binding protein
MPARYFVLLCDVLRARGVAVDALLQQAGISPARLYAPEATITLAQFQALVDASERIGGRSDLAFELGRQIKLSSHEILGYGIITSPTMDYALALVSRYSRLMTPVLKLQYRRGPETSELHFQPLLNLTTQSMQFLLEMAAVSAHEQIKSQLQQRLTPYDVHVSYAAPPHARRYRELKPARFHFGSERLPGARLVMDTALVSLTLPMADRSSLLMAEERCEELLRQTTQSAGMTEWVSMMLRESNEGMPTLAELARLLNQSPRTLDRRLNREGSKFLQLSKRIRHERACELLRAGLSATQVAYQVGYRDLANFTRAFRRESGMSPSEYLRAL